MKISLISLYHRSYTPFFSGMFLAIEGDAMFEKNKYFVNQGGPSGESANLRPRRVNVIIKDCAVRKHIMEEK